VSGVHKFTPEGAGAAG
jgi:uncharacterized membrane protein YphA (DoxX/SURF4 family)